MDCLKKEVAVPETAEAAKWAGLRYSTDAVPGFSRRGKPGLFQYLDPEGRLVRDKVILARIQKLAIPPAWQNVWIALNENLHLQATGRDAKGRKQYRYHPEFTEVRELTKFAHLADFAAALPSLRRRLRCDLRKPGLARDKVIAAVVTLLEETLIRIGNEDYARQNKSFGLTTLRNKHVRVRGKALRFQFKGKSGKIWNLSIEDRRVAKIVSKCQELPGQHLFEYIGEDSEVRSITSSDVNAYLREVSGKDISAKDFRTWAGTVHAADALAKISPPLSKKAIQQVVSSVAGRLGNTVAVCRRCYIHPHIFECAYRGALDLGSARGSTRGLSATEKGVLNILRRVTKSNLNLASTKLPHPKRGTKMRRR